MFKKVDWLTIVVLLIVVSVISFTLAWRDYDAEYRPLRMHIPAMQFHASSLADSTAVGGQTNTRTDSLLTPAIASAGSFRPQFRQIGTANAGGWRVGSKDMISVTFPVPDMDHHYGVAFRTWWLSTANGAVGSLRFKYNVRADTINAGTMGVSQGADSILTSRDSIGAANRVGFTKWDTLSYTVTRDWANTLIQFSIRVDTLGTTVIDSTFILAAEMAYIPKLTEGAGYRMSKVVQLPGPRVLGQSKGTQITGSP